MTERILLSASPVKQMPALTPLVAVMDRVDQMIVAVQNEVSSIARTIAQEFAQVEAYLVLQLDHILGIDPNPQNTSLNSSMPQTGNGSGKIVTMAPNASNQVSNNGTPQAGNGSGRGGNATIKPQDSPGGPDAVGSDYFTWNPSVMSNGQYLAGNSKNWLLNEETNTSGDVPGAHASDVVKFDPGDPNAKNGNANITWNYDATFSEMIVGATGAYTGIQTINSGRKVELTGGGGWSLIMNQPTSSLNLSFNASNSIFQLDNDAQITNMNLFTSVGSTGGQFNVNGGITTIAQSPGYTELLGVQCNIAKGAEVDDVSYNTLQFIGNNLAINVYGTMLVYYGTKATNTLIGTRGTLTGDYINVSGGTLKYAGNGNVTDTFQVPVLVQNGGTFFLTYAPNTPPVGTLIVQGTVPNMPYNASVYLTGDASTIQMADSVNLVAYNNYFQDSGTLEVVDSSSCTLQVGSGGSGTANINGGLVWIDTFANSFGELNLAGNLNLGGMLYVSAKGYTGTIPPPPLLDNDLLDVTGGLYINPDTATLYVIFYGPNQGNSWVVISSGQNIDGGFGSASSNPPTNFTYGIDPNNPKQYLISL